MKLRPELSIKHQAIFDQAKEFAATRLATQNTSFDHEGWRAAADFGLFRPIGVQVDRTHGATNTMAMLEGMGRGGADRRLLFAMGAHLFGCVAPFSRYATPEQSQRWDEHLRDGTIIGALAVTEASGGSSLENIETTAHAVSQGYLLDGQKTLIGNAQQADLFIVLARQFPDRGPLGLTAFLVPRDTDGVITSPLSHRPEHLAASLGRVEFKQCELPSRAILGAPGAGLRIFSTAMQWERSCLLSGFLGAAARDLALCVGILRSRAGKHGSLLQHQAVSHRLARMKVQLEGARLLAYRAAQHLDDGGEDYAVAAMAKFAVSEGLLSLATGSLRVLAGTAWRDESINFLPTLIDAFGGLFASGTSEMQLEMIARSLQAEERGN